MISHAHTRNFNLKSPAGNLAFWLDRSPAAASIIALDRIQIHLRTTPEFLQVQLRYHTAFYPTQINTILLELEYLAEANHIFLNKRNLTGKALLTSSWMLAVYKYAGHVDASSAQFKHVWRWLTVMLYGFLWWRMSGTVTWLPSANADKPRAHYSSKIPHAHYYFPFILITWNECILLYLQGYPLTTTMWYIQIYSIEESGYGMNREGNNTTIILVIHTT